MALPMDNSFDAYNAERLAAADTLLLGGSTYRMFRGFRPQMADNPDASKANRTISRLENAIDKVVVSDSPTEDETAPWSATTRIVARAVAHDAIAGLERDPGNDILTFGSRILWNGRFGCSAPRPGAAATTCSSVMPPARRVRPR